MTEQPETPTPDQIEQGKDVMAAGMEAAKAEPDPTKREEAAREGMRQEAERQNFPMSDEDLKRLSTVLAPMLTDNILNDFDVRGIYQAPPEPVMSPPPAPAAPSEAEHGETAPTEVQAPRKRSWAQKFLGE